MNIFEYAKFKKMFGGSGNGAPENNKPVYFASSVDELPSTATKNSLAYVTCNLVSYDLNDSITIPDDFKGRFFSDFFFTQVVSDGGTALRYGSLIVYDTATGWLSDQFKGIVAYEPNDAIIDWLNENGTLIVEGNGTIVHAFYNGEWKAIGLLW